MVEIETGASRPLSQRERAEMEFYSRRRLVHRTYQWLCTYEDELGTVKHEYKCISCGANPHVPERNLRFWTGHCSCPAPADAWGHKG